MIHIRIMTAHDVPLGMHLKEQAGWNQTEADWRRFLDLQPDGCFVAELDGRPVATATTCVLDSVGWIGMVLVEQQARGQGIGTRLMEHCLGYLDGRGVPTARLDATPLGLPIYEKLGFVVEYELVRMEGMASAGGAHAAVGPVAPDELDAVFELDLQVHRSNRSRLLGRLHRERPEAMHVFRTAGKITGYATFRGGANATQIGPAVAPDPEVGRALGNAVLACCTGRPIFVDVPTDNEPAIRWAESSGLAVQRPLTRMRRGKPVHDQPALEWASSGPEKG